MKNSLIKLHPLSIFFLIVAFLTGYFKYIIYLMSLIFIHELGHLTMAILLSFNVSKVVILPFGAMTILEDKINRFIWQELLIAIAGPIYQILFYYLLVALGFSNPLLTNIHMFLLIFNLLPIYTLDGSKIVHLFIQKFISFYYSNYVILILSFLCIPFLYKESVLWIIIIIYLLYEQIIFIRKLPFIFSKFLLERVLYNFNFKKVKKVSNVYQMKRDFRHIFKVDSKLVDEKKYLKKYIFKV